MNEELKVNETETTVDEEEAWDNISDMAESEEETSSGFGSGLLIGLGAAGVTALGLFIYNKVKNRKAKKTPSEEEVVDGEATEISDEDSDKPVEEPEETETDPDDDEE